MRLQYSGYAELVQRTDFDLPRFFDDWQRELASAGPVISFDRGVVARLRTLRAVLPDNHHYVGGPGQWGPRLREEPQAIVREYQATVASADAVGPLDSCRIEGAGTPFPYTVRVAQSLRTTGANRVLTVSVRGGADRAWLHCAGGTFELPVRPLVPKHEAPTPNDDLYTWRAIGDTAVITVRSLLGTGAQMKQLGQLVKDYDEHRRFARIVFDFRGNGGGNDSPVFGWIAKAKKGTWASGAERELMGALTPCQIWNPLLERQIRDGSVDTPQARAEREQVRSRWPRGPHRAAWVFRSGLDEDESEHPYTGRVYALVDRYAASSGEGGPMLLKSALGATLIGERTSGTYEFGDVRAYILPHSGVRWNLATKVMLVAQPLETVGLGVDAYLADARAPVEQILPMLDQLR
jgi:hypothetical protein